MLLSVRTAHVHTIYSQYRIRYDYDDSFLKVAGQVMSLMTSRLRERSRTRPNQSKDVLLPIKSIRYLGYLLGTYTYQSYLITDAGAGDATQHILAIKGTGLSGVQLSR